MLILDWFELKWSLLIQQILKVQASGTREPRGSACERPPHVGDEFPSLPILDAVGF
jgi:hypothetical protein